MLIFPSSIQCLKFEVGLRTFDFEQPGEAAESAGGFLPGIARKAPGLHRNLLGYLAPSPSVLRLHKLEGGMDFDVLADNLPPNTSRHDADARGHPLGLSSTD